MQTAIQHTKPTPPALPFRWRDRTGAFHAPEQMETRHLFYTLRMIWNHTMPEGAKLRPYNAYSFGKHYTREYMISAVKALAAELGTRTNLTATWQRDLDAMVAWLSTNQIAHDAQPKLLTVQPATH